MDGTTDPGTTNFTTGGEGVYTLRVNNLGTNATVDDINVVDDVPDRFQVLEASGTNWNCLVENPTPANPISNPAADSINNNIVRCARSTAMAAGTSSTIRIRVKPIATWIPAEPKRYHLVLIILPRSQQRGIRIRRIMVMHQVQRLD